MAPIPTKVFLSLQISIFACFHSEVLASIHQSDGEAERCEEREHAGGVALLATQVIRKKVNEPQASQPLPFIQVVPELLQTQKITEYVHGNREKNVDSGDELANAGNPASAHPIVDGARDDNYVEDNDGPSISNSTLGGSNESGSLENIIEAADEPAEKKHSYAMYIVAPLSFVFFAVFTLSNVMEKFEITAIPESAILIFFGTLLSVFCTMYAKIELSDELFSHMMPKVLNLVLLPILMFEAGWTVRRQDFFSQFPHILMFAFVGVGLSTCCIGGLIYVTGSYGFHTVTTIRVALAYATLISATDPVATMSTYAKLKVDPLLNIMVFGESIINDAVAIVFFNVLNSDHFMMNKHGDAMSGMELTGSILYGVGKIFLGSIAIGVGLGMTYTLIANWADMRENKKGQILVILASCYLTYALAESVSMSGIIATMFSGLLMGVYMRPHLSKEGSLLATFFIKQLSSLADAGVFLLVGFSVMQLDSNGWYFGLWVMLFCLVGRAVSVFPVGFTVNALKTGMGMTARIPKEGWNLLSFPHMFMMWHAGLRGGIALALSLELGKWVDVIDGPGTRRTLQTATFLLIVAFLVIFGGSTSFFLKKLGIPLGQDAPADVLSKTENLGRLREFMQKVDHRFMSPLLLGDRWKDFKSEESEEDVVDYLKSVRSY